MRKIKFRAWCKADKMMYCNVQEGIVFEDGSRYEFNRFLGEYKQEADDYHEWVLMQYIGLEDKNGKEIYEGDILERSSNPSWAYNFAEKGVVIYNGSCFILTDRTPFPSELEGTPVGKNKGLEWIEWPDDFFTNDRGYCVVIGNIYQNLGRMSNTYTCAKCKGVFEKGRSDKEAIAEKEELWGSVPLEDCDIICDDCFNEIMP